MKKNCLYILSFLLLLMLQAEMLQGQQTPETEINESAEQEPMAEATQEELQGWMSMAIAMAEHDPELREELNAFNALPKEEKAKAFSLAGDLVNSVVVNKQVKNQLGVLADQDIVVLFKVDGVLLFSYIAEKLINREYREGKMVISVNHETGTEGIVNITADLENAEKDYVKALLEKYNLTAEQVVAIANGLISSKYQGGVQSFSLSTVAEKKVFVEEVIAAVVEGVEGVEEVAYDPEEYISKVFQLIRCGNINQDFDFTFDRKFKDPLNSTPRYGGTVGWYCLLDNDLQLVTSKVNVAETTGSMNGGQVVYFTLDYGKVVIRFVDHAGKDHSATRKKLNDLNTYLFPNGSSDIVNDYNEVLSLLNKPSLSSDDIEVIKGMANCGAHLFTAVQRTRLIKEIASRNSLEEYYEDLLLDLFQTTPEGTPSKELLDNILKDKSLRNILFSDIDNVFLRGNEDNADRLAIELLSLFYKGYGINEIDQKYKSLRADQKLYFHGFGNYCQWTVSTSKDDDKFYFTEKEIYNYVRGGPGPTGSWDQLPSCDKKVVNYSFEHNEFVAVTLVEEGLLGMKDGIVVMPASVYYLLLKNQQNKRLYQQINATWMALGVLTPFDEFYLLSQAIKLGNRGFKALRFGSVAEITKIKKIDIVLNAKGEDLKRLSAGKLDNFVVWKADGSFVDLTDDALDLSAPLVMGSVEMNLLKLEGLTGKNYLDVVVHGEGRKFFIDGQAVEGKELAEFIKGKVSGNHPVRLLSCSDLNSAQQAADHLGVEVIANNGLTRIHADGSITIVDDAGNAVEKWYRLKPGEGLEKAEEFTVTAQTSRPNDYIELGNGGAKVVGGGVENLTFAQKSQRFNKQQNALLTYERLDGTFFMHKSPSQENLTTGYSNEVSFSFKYNSGPNANSKDLFGTMALTDEGYLVGNLKKPTGMDNLQIKGVTEDVFDMALYYFGQQKVKGIKSLWVKNPDLYPYLPDNKSINLIKFEEAIKSMDENTAAFQTVTGEYARVRNFSKIDKIRKLSEATDGVYGYEVTFIK